MNNSEKTLPVTSIAVSSKPVSKRVRLVVSDIDGTLIRSDKTLSSATKAAALQLKKAGVSLCLVSSRSEAGMRRYLQELNVSTPFGALNGALLFQADGSVLTRHVLDKVTVEKICAYLTEKGIDTWFYRDHEWLVREGYSDYVDHERRSVGIEPRIVADFVGYETCVGKIMGASHDGALLAAAENDLHKLLQGRASIHRSSDYYLDITHPEATKGHAARSLAAQLGVSMDEVACIGDMKNDIPMLSIAGLAIAMGNARAEVSAHAHYRTRSNDEDGWAEAMEQFVLPLAPQS